MAAPGWALAIAGWMSGTVGTGSDGAPGTALPLVTRFEGSFGLDATTPDYDPLGSVGRYALGRYDFSFFRGDVLVGKLVSGAVVPRSNSLTVINRTETGQVDELMLFVQQSVVPKTEPKTDGELSIQSLSLGFQVPATTWTSDRLPGQFDSDLVAQSLTKAVIGTLGLGRSGTQPLMIQSAQLSLDSVTPVPTPALLPGLLGLGLGVLRKRQRA